ncbi:MAG: hypothetical protein ACHQ1D_00695 [Nitrososphaerales archaeon]
MNSCCQIWSALSPEVKLNAEKQLDGLPVFVTAPTRDLLNNLVNFCPKCGFNYSDKALSQRASIPYVNIPHSHHTGTEVETTDIKCTGDSGCNGTGLISGLTHARCLGTGYLFKHQSPPMTPEQEQRAQEELAKAQKAQRPNV